MESELKGYSEELSLTSKEILVLKLLNSISVWSQQNHNGGEEDKFIDQLGETIANSDAYRSAQAKIHVQEEIAKKRLEEARKNKEIFDIEL
jgi:predicted transglutaminase-like protease